MVRKYPKIRRPPHFVSTYAKVSSYLKKSSPMAYFSLSQGMKTVLDVIEAHPRGWPVRRKNIGGLDLEFHIAVVSLSYRKLHVRYAVDDNDVSHLLDVWVDGNDEPSYTTDSADQ